MRKHALVLGLVAAVSLPAAADGLYVFGDVGQSKFSGDISETDNALALGLGYNLNSTFSFELAYHDLGGFGISDSVYEPSVGYIDVDASVDVTAYSLSALAKLPLSEKFDIYGRLGYAHVSIDSKGTGSALGITVPVGVSDSENKATYGVGAAYKVNEKFALRADYVKFGDMDLSSFTVGATYTF
ncbi:porin family protein [Cellvibrio sp.]|uniref:porin family protein n=1 Tax=Cellvibrio sp. TaxID=1965322 RepID=UPI0039647AB3